MTEEQKALREEVAIALSKADPDERGLPDGVAMAEFYRSLADVAISLVGERMARVRAENEKLRAALEMFACDCVENDLCKFPHACRNYVARAALEEK